MEMYEMNNFSRKQIMKGLKELIPEINFMKTSEEFNGKKMEELK